MEKAILGKKLGMTQIFTPEGEVVPVTVIEAGPCYVVQKKTAAIDGYEAIQVGFGKIKEKHVTKPQAGHLPRQRQPRLNIYVNSAWLMSVLMK